MKKYSRFIAPFFTLVLIFALTACGSGSSESLFNPENSTLGKQVLDTVDSYLDGYLSASSTTDRLDSFREQIDQSDENALYLDSDILCLSIYVLCYDGGYSDVTLTDIIDSRNALASDIGADPYR